MMIEYDGREQVLIGELSTMLAAKNRESYNEGDSDSEWDTSNTDEIASTFSSFSFSKPNFQDGLVDETSGTKDYAADNVDQSGNLQDSAETLESDPMDDNANAAAIAGGVVAGGAFVGAAVMAASQLSSDDKERENDIDGDYNVSASEASGSSSNSNRSSPANSASNSYVDDNIDPSENLQHSSETLESEPMDDNINTAAIAGGALVGAAAIASSQLSKSNEESESALGVDYDDSGSESSGWSSNSDGLSSMNSASFDASDASSMDVRQSSMLAALAAASTITERVSMKHEYTPE